MDDHAYYYPVYDSADLSSEAYIQHSTESTEPQENNTETSASSENTETQTDILESGAKAFIDSDLYLLGFSDTTDPVSIEPFMDVQAGPIPLREPLVSVGDQPVFDRSLTFHFCQKLL